jgi:hypothetical protein
MGKSVLRIVVPFRVNSVLLLFVMGDAVDAGISVALPEMGGVGKGIAVAVLVVVVVVFRLYTLQQWAYSYRISLVMMVWFERIVEEDPHRHRIGL